MKEKIAIIDLGSNSVRLVLVEINQDNSYRIVNEVKEMVRLSENMGEENILKPLAIRRTLQTIKLFEKLCRASGVDKILAVATAAVRKAKNQTEFLKMIEDNTGISFEVISGEQEAYLGCKAVDCTMDTKDGILVDIGGGSTEISKFIDRRIVGTISLPYGAVNLTEVFLDKNLSTPKQLEAIENFLTRQLAKIPWLKDERKLPVIGLGGTVRALSKIDRVKKGYSLDLTHNYRMNRADIEIIYNDIKYKRLEQRLTVPGMAKERADIIIAGACAIAQLLAAAEARELIISGNGIREGVFFTYYLDRLGLEKIENITDFSLNNFMKLSNVNMTHGKQVCRLALSVFDQLAGPCGIPLGYRSIFERAALIHDVGVNIDFYNRDEHTYYLVSNSRINGFTHREKLLTAMIASEFTGEKLKRCYMRHRDIVSREDYEAAKKLTALLTICDKLDRSKSSVIEKLECKFKYDSIIIETQKGGDAELELSEANKHQSLFRKVFEQDIIVI